MYDDARSTIQTSRQTDPAAQITTMMTTLTKICCPEPQLGPDEVLASSMAYSMALRGKRVRGLLVLMITDGFGTDWRRALDCARAVEMVHTASLIIDDLPSMDDAGTRRGQPTNHVKFGEATAILAAIALLSEALVLLSTSHCLTDGQRAAAVACLGRAVGLKGMTDGQQRDLFPVGTSLAHIDIAHARKTGALFAAAMELGAIVARASADERALIHQCGMNLGKAFQGFDDLLDVTCATEDLGKDTGKDIGKPTFADSLGPVAADQQAVAQIEQAIVCMGQTRATTSALLAFIDQLTATMRTPVHTH